MTARNQSLLFHFIFDEYIGFDPHQFGILDARKLYQLTGAYYYHTSLILSLDTGMWNHQTEYLGYEIGDLSEIARYAYQMRNVIEKEPWAHDKELAAYAIMPIDINNYPGFSKGLTSPVADPDGQVIAANMIWRDKKSRYLYPMQNRWTCGDVYHDTIELLTDGISEFADTVAQHDLFRARVAQNQQLVK